MLKTKRIRIMMVFICVLSLAAFVFGCSPSGSKNTQENTANDNTENSKTGNTPMDIQNTNAIFNFYNKVQINQKKAEVEKNLGVAPVVDTDGSSIYTDPSTGYAVNVYYSAGDLVSVKAVISAPGGGELIALSNAKVTEAQAGSILEGMTYDEVKAILGGEGLPIAEMAYPGVKDKKAYGLSWINADGSMILVTFDGDEKTVMSTEFKGV